MNPSSKRMSIFKKISLKDQILLGINGIVGSGIFLLPGQLESIIGHSALLTYIFVALIVLSIAWCFCECAAHFPQSGGSYIYSKEAFGNFIGFEVGIMKWAICVIAWATLTSGFVTALSELWPGVMHSPSKELMMIGIILILGVINVFGVSAIQWVNNLSTIAKFLPLLAFIGIGFFFIYLPNFDHFQLQMITPTNFGAASLIAFYAFTGFEGLPVASGEMKNPQRNIPIALMTSIIFCFFLYVCIQIICMGILGDQLAGSVNPVADAAYYLLGGSGELFVAFATLIAIGGTTFVASFITPRSCTPLAVDQMLPQKLAKLGRFGSPTWSIWISVLMTIIVALSGSFMQLIAISVVSRFAQYIVTCLALFAFAKRGVFNPFQSKWKIAIPLIALSGMCWLLLQAKPYQLLWGLAALVLGVPLYFLQKKYLPKTAPEEIKKNIHHD